MKAITGLVMLALASTAAGEDPEERKRARVEVRKIITPASLATLRLRLFRPPEVGFVLVVRSSSGAASGRLRLLYVRLDLSCV